METPKNKQGKLIHIDKTLLKKLKIQAIKSDVSLKNYIETLLENHAKK